MKFINSFIYGSLLYSFLDLDQIGVQNINSVIFLLVTNTSTSNMFPVLASYAPLMTLYLRENKNGMYRVINLYLAKFFSDVIKSLYNSVEVLNSICSFRVIFFRRFQSLLYYLWFLQRLFIGWLA